MNYSEIWPSVIVRSFSIFRNHRRVPVIKITGPDHALSAILRTAKIGRLTLNPNSDGNDGEIFISGRRNCENFALALVAHNPPPELIKVLTDKKISDSNYGTIDWFLPIKYSNFEFEAYFKLESLPAFRSF